MSAHVIRIFLLPLIVVWIAGCADHTTDSAGEKYPRKTVVSDERKSGPAMLFYEAAEKDADPANVIVIPPEDSTRETP